MARVPFVVALNRTTGVDDGRGSRIRAGARASRPTVPLVPCDATDKESVKAVLLALLYAVLDEVEADARRLTPIRNRHALGAPPPAEAQGAPPLRRRRGTASRRADARRGAGRCSGQPRVDVPTRPQPTPELAPAPVAALGSCRRVASTSASPTDRRSSSRPRPAGQRLSCRGASRWSASRADHGMAPDRSRRLSDRPMLAEDIGAVRMGRDDGDAGRTAWRATA